MKTAAEILKELQFPKEKTAMKADKYPYFKHWEYMERMNSVIGRENYSPTYSELQVVPLPTGQVLVTCRCHIDVFDDGRAVILSSDGYASKEIERSSSSGDFIMLNNIAYNCQQAAFNDACKGFDIFSDTTTDDEAGDKPRNNGTVGNKTPSSKRFLVKGHMNLLRTDEQSHKPVYSISAYEVISDTQCSNKRAEILFYPNQYSGCVARFNEFCACRQEPNVADKIYTFKISETSRSTEKEPRFTFKGFA